MRFLLAFTALFIYTASFAQDTTFTDKIKVIDEVIVSLDASTIFDQENQYIIDFHIDSLGSYLLLKKKNYYILSRMDDSFKLKSNLLLHFKPIGLHRNCMSELFVISNDSVYKIEEQLADIEIYEPNPLKFYENYFQNCQLETSNHLLYKKLMESNQVHGFYTVHKEQSIQKPVYYAYDSVLVENSREWTRVLMHDGINPYDKQQFGIAAILLEREKFQHYTYYHQIISKEEYIPVFQNDSNVFLFNHFIDSVLIFDESNYHVTSRNVISFHKIRGWQKLILMDQATHRFYTLFFNNGNLYVATLSSTDFSILYSRKVQGSILTKRFMIYNGYLYYDTKTNFDSSFNELKRQRL